MSTKKTVKQNPFPKIKAVACARSGVRSADEYAGFGISEIHFPHGTISGAEHPT